jgi:hypothetical protein
VRRFRHILRGTHVRLRSSATRSIHNASNRLMQCLIPPPRRPSAAGQSRTANDSARSGGTGPVTAIRKRCGGSDASMRLTTARRATSATAARSASASRVAGFPKAACRRTSGRDGLSGDNPVAVNDLKPRSRPVYRQRCLPFNASVAKTEPLTRAVHSMTSSPTRGTHVAERHRRAGGVFGFHPSITLVAAGPTPLSELGGSLVSGSVARIERASARSAAALISALLNCRATRRGLYFAGGCSSFGSLIGTVADLPIGANSGPSPPLIMYGADRHRRTGWKLLFYSSAPASKFDRIVRPNAVADAARECGIAKDGYSRHAGRDLFEQFEPFSTYATPSTERTGRWGSIAGQETARNRAHPELTPALPIGRTQKRVQQSEILCLATRGCVAPGEAAASERTDRWARLRVPLRPLHSTLGVLPCSRCRPAP